MHLWLWHNKECITIRGFFHIYWPHPVYMYLFQVSPAVVIMFLQGWLRRGDSWRRRLLYLLFNCSRSSRLWKGVGCCRWSRRRLGCCFSSWKESGHFLAWMWRYECCGHWCRHETFRRRLKTTVEVGEMGSSSSSSLLMIVARADLQWLVWLERSSSGW